MSKYDDVAELALAMKKYGLSARELIEAERAVTELAPLEVPRSAPRSVPPVDAASRDAAEPRMVKYVAGLPSGTEFNRNYVREDVLKWGGDIGVEIYGCSPAKFITNFLLSLPNVTGLRDAEGLLHSTNPRFVKRHHVTEG